MPLNVNTDAGKRPRPQIVAPATVVKQARDIGSPNAEKALAVTQPILTIDQNGLQYEQRKQKGGVEFRFNTGVLRLTLRQNIYIANNLSACAQGIWGEHEQDHVLDNQGIMAKMERKIRAHRDLQTIFFNPQWRPKSSFNAI